MKMEVCCKYYFTQFLNVKADCRAFIFAVAGLSGEEFTSLRTMLYNAALVGAEFSLDASRRISPCTRFAQPNKVRSPAALQKDKRGGIAFGTVRVDGA